MSTLLKRTTLVAVIVVAAVALILCTGCSGLLEADLRLAACDGDIKKVTNLLKRGANVNATGVLGTSALISVEACTRHDERGSTKNTSRVNIRPPLKEVRDF